MKIVIIGGDAAGMSAAMQIKRRKPDWDIKVFEKGEHTSYGSCGIPYYFTGDVKSIDSLVVVKPEEFHKKGINVSINHEVIDINTENKVVKVENKISNEVFDYEYDKLLIASGASPIVPKLEGINLDGVFTVKNITDTQKLDSYLSKNIKKAVIVGAGYIGLEMAEALSKKGLEVTIIEKLSGVIGNINEKLNELVIKELSDNNIKINLETSVKSFKGENNNIKAVVTDKGEIETDLVILSLGVKPNISFLRNTPIKIGSTGAIEVNEYQETNIENIYSAGDCSESFHRVLKKNVFIPLALTANRQGRVAGANITDEKEKFPGVLGSASTKIFELAIARTGIDKQTADKEGIEVLTVENTAGSKAHYYKGHAPVYVQIIYSAKDYKVLGALLVGKDESLSKRSDIIATAISAGLDITELSDLDLSYAPPFSPVWDPILQAANKARFSIKK
jgi:NADPH-dependent 2,4-dienoyl-CoA reductase/sulfur reductase-like enzyme